MWQKFIDWLKSLFGSEDPTSFEDEEFFAGALVDEPDARDQVFGETK